MYRSQSRVNIVLESQIRQPYTCYSCYQLIFCAQIYQVIRSYSQLYLRSLIVRSRNYPNISIDWEMTNSGYGQVNTKRNQVTESMISTVSQAFEFQDYLGEKTTLKDRVPKNKANLDKKIVHFSREVAEDRGFASNTLSSYNPNRGFQKKSTFQNYMSDDFLEKLKQQLHSINQLPLYSSPQPRQYEPPKYTDNSSNYSYTPRTSSVHSQHKSSYQSSFSSSGKFTSSYGSEHLKSESEQRIQHRPAPQSSYTKLQNNYGSQEPRSFNTSYQHYPSNQPISSSNPSGSDDRTNWAPKSAIINNSGSSSTNSPYQNSHPHQPVYPSSTSIFKPSQPILIEQSKYPDRSENTFGEYSKDFSSPEIMQIMNKRRKQ